MKLYLKTSGGIGNISIRGQIDTEDLPRRLAEHVRSVFDAAKLASLPSQSGTGPVVDGLQYEVQLMTGDQTRRFFIDESNAPDDLIDILQDLIQEIIRQKTAQ